MEEDYEVRGPQGGQNLVNVGEGAAPVRGGAGGIGAMNPGAQGRGHPETTARLDDAGDTTIQVQPRSDEQPPEAGYVFELGPLDGDGSHPESVVQSIEADSSAGRWRSGLSLVLLLTGTTVSMMNYLL